MKKTLKSIIAAALALTLLFCSFVPAFAFEVGDNVEWCYCSYDYVDFYTYAGVITEGENEFILSNRYNCFTADFEKPGFYLFSFNEELVNSIVVSEKIHDGAPCGEINILHSNDEGKVLAYIPDEETYIGFRVANELSVVNVEISYYDYEIADIVFENGDLENLVYGGDFRLSEGENKISIRSDIEVLFENGEKYFTEFGRLDFALNGEIAYGENKVTFNLADYSEEVTITVCYAMNYIQKIEITNLEKYLYSVRYYDGRIKSAFDNGALENETVTITYWDGTVETYSGLGNYGRIELPNGRFYDVWLEALDKGDSVEFVVTVAGQILLARECSYRNATVIENLTSLNKYIGLHVERISDSFKSIFKRVANGNSFFAELSDWVSSEFMKAEINYIREAVEEFMTYYTSVR